MQATPPLVEVVIEVPRGSCVKRGSLGHVDFVSPLPCPYNYGSVPTHIGLEGDLLDAVVLGPRLPLGTRLTIAAWGAVTLIDRGIAVLVEKPLGVSVEEWILYEIRAAQLAMPSDNVVNLQKRVAGILPVRIDVPKSGRSYRFVRTLVLDEETRISFNYKSK